MARFLTPANAPTRRAGRAGLSRRPRHAHRWDDTGSLPLALLVTLVGVMLTGLLASTLTVQLGASRADAQRVRALNAAQTGLDVALGHIKAAEDGSGAGLLSRLPCGPLSGRVGTGSTARYEVTIEYYDADPRGQDDAWLTAHRIACGGSGAAALPAYARLRADGTDLETGTMASVPKRSLWGTYTFLTTRGAPPGGLIRVFRSGTGTQYCLDAGSPDPVVNTGLVIQPCSPGATRQTFVYNRNLTITLVSSRTATRPLGLCLDAGALAHSLGRPVQLVACLSATDRRQQWSLNNRFNFEGSTSTGALSGFCFNVQQPDTAGSAVVLGQASTTCRGTRFDSRQTFLPEAAVGTGQADALTGQLVNFGQYARCAEVNGTNTTAAYMIVAPCRQSPDPAYVTWQQKWSVPTTGTGIGSATGQISVAPSTTAFCLRIPQPPAAGQYATFAACPTGTTPLPDAMTWTAHAWIGDLDTSYRITEKTGRFCLAPTDQSASSPDLHNPTSTEDPKISKLVIQTCGSSLEQKWNAPPDVLGVAPLKDITER